MFGFKKSNPNFPGMEKFLASDATKLIFDNVRNIILATVVIGGGHFLYNRASAISGVPSLTMTLGVMLGAVGFLLLFLNVFHGHHKIVANIGCRPLAWAMSALYTLLAIQLFASILRLNGVVG